MKLSQIQKDFPKVKQIVDATESIQISVEKQDVTKGVKKSPGSCALARACVRDLKVDGAYINIGFSYVVDGDTAVRFKTPVTVGREITSFDRHHDFATGKDYTLSKVSPASRLGLRKRPPGKHGGHKTKVKKPMLHRTVRVRKVNKYKK